MSARVLVIRHGQSLWNAARRWQGQADPPLSEAGRGQVGDLARRLARQGRFAAVIASDLRRARESAEIVAAALGLAPDADPRLRERDLGAWSGRTTNEIAARWPDELARLRARDPALRPGGGETLVELEARVAAALADLRARFRGRVAVVTHKGVADVIVPGSALANAGACWAAAAVGGRAESAPPGPL